MKLKPAHQDLTKMVAGTKYRFISFAFQLPSSHLLKVQKPGTLSIPILRNDSFHFLFAQIPDEL